MNKAGYTATLVACGWAGAVLEKVTRASGQEPYAQKGQKRRKSKKGTDRPTDQPKKRGVKIGSMRLKNEMENDNQCLPVLLQAAVKSAATRTPKNVRQFNSLPPMTFSVKGKLRK